LRLRLPEFHIPDLPRGMLLATIFFAVAWLAAFPDVPYAWVWGLIMAAGIVTWVMGSGWQGPAMQANHFDNRPGLIRYTAHQPTLRL
jgi:hypothetical protein